MATRSTLTIDRPESKSASKPRRVANTGRSESTEVATVTPPVAPAASGNDKHKYWTEKQQDACVSKIKSTLGKNVVNNVTVGKLLADAQNNVDPGTWGIFLSQNLRWQRRAVEKFQAIYDHPVIRRVLENTDEGKRIAAALPDAWTSLAVLAGVGFDRAEKVGGRSFRLYKDDGQALFALINEGRVFPHMQRADCQALSDEYAGKEPGARPTSRPTTVSPREQELEAQVADLEETLARVTTQTEQDGPEALPAADLTEAQRFALDVVKPLLAQVVTFADLEAALMTALSEVQAQTVAA